LKSTFPEIHILVNNAAQTITRPPEYFSALLKLEAAPLTAVVAKQLCILPAAVIEPEIDGTLDLVQTTQDIFEGEVLDMRDKNSWVYKIDEVSTEEMVQVQTVNVVSPFLLCSKLKQHMARTKGNKFVINVSAMEGKFYRAHKHTNHPHTNMAKAALNMMTRTSAGDFAKDQIFMNSVDPGWITNENPAPIAERMEDRYFRTPIDCVDAAARILDPIFQAANGAEPVYGLFLKDYAATEW